MNLGNPNSKLCVIPPPTGELRVSNLPIESLPRTILAQLAAADLTPTPRVNALFSALVDHALSTQSPEILSDRTALSQLHTLCARAEAELERHWAQKITQQRARISDFPYWDNYLALAEGENAALRKTSSGSRLVFIGCGPLPLSAIALLQVDPQWQLTCIDSDPQAVKTAAELVTRLGLESTLKTAISAGEDFDYGSTDIALVAALAGADAQAKLRILAQVADSSHPGTLIAARSVPGDGRRLLYPMLEPDTLAAALGWPLKEHWQPSPPVINSLLIWGRPEVAWAAD